MQVPKYTIEVYRDHAIIRGFLTTDVLLLMVRLCKKEGFTHMIPPADGSQGFKLVKR